MRSRRRCGPARARRQLRARQCGLTARARWTLPRRRVVPPHLLNLRRRVRAVERHITATATDTGAKPAVSKIEART